MAQGHLIAIAGAPILDSEGLRVIARWARDLRGPEFAAGYEWYAHDKLRASPITGDSEVEFMAMPAAMTAQRHRANLIFAAGPVQVWKMESAVKAEDMEKVFADARFMPEQGHGPNDTRKVYNAACALLNATRLPLSEAVRAELKIVALESRDMLIEQLQW